MGYWCQQPDGELENMRQRKKETDFELVLIFYGSQHVNPCLTYCAKIFFRSARNEEDSLALKQCVHLIWFLFCLEIYIYIYKKPPTTNAFMLYQQNYNT